MLERWPPSDIQGYLLPQETCHFTSSAKCGSIDGILPRDTDNPTPSSFLALPEWLTTCRVILWHQHLFPSGAPAHLQGQTWRCFSFSLQFLFEIPPYHRTQRQMQVLGFQPLHQCYINPLGLYGVVWQTSRAKQMLTVGTGRRMSAFDSGCHVPRQW
jgi:hypothetical protein